MALVIPEDRKFKTLTSVIKSNDFRFFEKLIKFTDFCLKYYEEEEVDKVIYLINNIISEDPDSETSFLSYAIGFLYYLHIIRPKITTNYSKIISSTIYPKLSQEQQDNISNIIDFYRNKYEYLHHRNIAEPSNLEIFFDEIDNTIKNDDLASFKTFSLNKLFSYTKETFISQKYCMHYIFHLIFFYPIIDHCAFYGAFNCFKFVLINSDYRSDSIARNAILGGNFEIIHLLECEGITFDDTFRLSIGTHRLEISEWLLSNYKCSIDILSDFIKYYDYRLFLFIILNDFIITKQDNILSQICLAQEVTDELIQYLLEKEANVDDNCLFYLCNSKLLCIKCIKDFVEKGVINKSNYYSLLSSLFLYSTPKHAELIKYFVQKGFDIKKDISLYISLFKNCLKKSPCHIKLLIELGGDPGDYLKNYIIASQCCMNPISLDDLKWSIHNGYNINPDINRYYLNIPPPIISLLKNSCDIEALKLLLDNGANPNLTYIGMTALSHYFLQNKKINMDIIKLLVEHRYNLNKIQNNHQTILYIAIRKLSKPDVYDVIKYFLLNGVNLNDGWKNRFPLFYLCSKYEVDIDLIKLLLENGTDVNQSKNSPLAALIYHSTNYEVMKLLIEKGIDINKDHPLNILLKKKGSSVNYDIVKYFIDKGADVNYSTTYFDCKSPLFYASQNCNIDIIQLLLEKGAKVNQKILKNAKKRKDKEILKLIIKYKGN